MNVCSELLDEEISPFDQVDNVAGVGQHLNELNVLDHLAVPRVLVLVDVGFDNFFRLVVHAHGN